MRKKAVLRRIAAWTLLVLVAAFADNAYRHTDDGCAVETHCTACLSAYVPATPGVASPAHVFALVLTEAVAPLEAIALPQVVVAPRETRGPPALA